MAVSVLQASRQVLDLPRSEELDQVTGWRSEVVQSITAPLLHIFQLTNQQSSRKQGA